VLALAAVAVGLLLTAIVGLFAYMNATATPLHPDPLKVSSVSRFAPPAEWAEAAVDAAQRVRDGLIAQNLPGVSAAVAMHGRIVWAEGFGDADLEKKTPVEPETLFRIGEVSNPLTSAAVGVLLEKRKLNLDADVRTYVPSFPAKQWPVTLRELMAYQSGIRNDEGDEEPIHESCDQALDGLKRFSRQQLLFEPGTRYHPSSYGWILVSAAVEAAAGEPFFVFMRTHVFEPLGMSATRPGFWKDSIPNRATFYFPRFAGDTKYGPDLAREGDHSCAAGGGAFLSTPSDLVRFGLAIDNGTLLTPATVAMLRTPQRLASGQQTDYGLGWKIETIPLAGKPARMASHGSKPDFIGGTASLLTFPGRGVVVAVTSNTSFADTSSIARQIAEAFAQRDRSARGEAPGSK
jgi:CubicO group peptidase (beta-lactamase class C family)